jgi:hypothetical protein
MGCWHSTEDQNTADSCKQLVSRCMTCTNILDLRRPQHTCASPSQEQEPHAALAGWMPYRSANRPSIHPLLGRLDAPSAAQTGHVATLAAALRSVQPQPPAR